MNAGSSFAADAAIYDRSRRQLVPCFDDFYGIAAALSPFERDAAIHILDLGAGTGLMSAFFADAHRHARFTLVDVAGEMLDRARARFARDAGRFACVTLDYAMELPSGTFDLVVSGLSIHHLADGNKIALFRRVYAALRPDGAFINADQVLGRTPAVEARNHAAWLAGACRLGVSQADLDAAMERMKHDRTATLADQLRWLDEAGFRDVDCAYKHYRFAVYGGRK
jgi:tRNA (cmo5U34)-methyltransferase